MHTPRSESELPGVDENDLTGEQITKAKECLASVGNGPGVVDPVALVFDGPPDVDGNYPLPDTTISETLVEWVERHPQVPDRDTLKRLLAAFGWRLPTSAEAKTVFQSATVQCPDLPVPLRDELLRVMMPDGRLVYPGDPEEVQAQGGRLAVIAVRPIES